MRKELVYTNMLDDSEVREVLQALLDKLEYSVWRTQTPDYTSIELTKRGED